MTKLFISASGPKGYCDSEVQYEIHKKFTTNKTSLSFHLIFTFYIPVNVKFLNLQSINLFFISQIKTKSINRNENLLLICFP